jgi:hypothetical protein
VTAATNGLKADAAREAVKNAPAAVESAAKIGVRQASRYVRGVVTGETGSPATLSDILKEGSAGIGDWSRKTITSTGIKNAGIGAGTLLAGAGIYKASGAADRKRKSDAKFRDRVYSDALAYRDRKPITMSAREELDEIIEFRIAPSITYHDIEQKIQSRKARVHREKSNEYIAGAGLAAGAGATISSIPELRSAIEGGIQKAGVKVIENTPSVKMAGGRPAFTAIGKAGDFIAQNPRKILNTGIVGIPVALGGAALAHRIAGWSNDSKANKAQKRAQAVRMERFRKLQASHPPGTKFSARDELGMILFARGDQAKKALSWAKQQAPEAFAKGGKISNAAGRDLRALRRNEVERKVANKNWRAGISYGIRQSQEGRSRAVKRTALIAGSAGLAVGAGGAIATRKKKDVELSSRDELNTILFEDLKARASDGTYSGGAGGSQIPFTPAEAKSVYDPRRLGMPRPKEGGLLPGLRGVGRKIMKLR